MPEKGLIVLIVSPGTASILKRILNNKSTLTARRLNNSRYPDHCIIYTKKQGYWNVSDQVRLTTLYTKQKEHLDNPLR